MTDERPHAYLVHSISGRARLRFPEQRGSEPFFRQLTASLKRLPGVLQVRASAYTGSVLILHAGELSSLLSDAQQRGWLELAPPAPPRASFKKLQNAIDFMDDSVAKGTGDTLSVGKLLFAGLVSAGIYQTNQGHLLPAGMTLFRHALELLDWVAEREPSISRDRS